MALELEDLQQLAAQLKTLPGGAQAAIPDFFGSLLTSRLASINPGSDLDNWELKEGGILCLRTDPAIHTTRLFHAKGEDELQIAAFHIQILDVARAHETSPIVLALLAIATGQADDGRRLKARLPRVDAAAKDLMLMTVCRLCG